MGSKNYATYNLTRAQKQALDDAVPAPSDLNPIATIQLLPAPLKGAVADPAHLTSDVHTFADNDVWSVISKGCGYQFSAESTQTPDGDLVVLAYGITPPAPGRWIRGWADIQHNATLGLDTGDYRHLTSAAKTAVVNHAAATGNAHGAVPGDFGAYTKGEVDSALSGKSGTGHKHTGADGSSKVAGSDIDGAVAEATHAGSADNATNANHATSADSATAANSATTAGHATTADSATTAGSATTATTANHATTADSATTAGSATTATNAGHATTADSATTAGSATSATTAGDAATLDGQHAAAFAAAAHGHPLSAITLSRTPKGNANHTLAATDVLVDYTAARDASYTVSLPDALLALAGQVWIIADGGRDAATHNIIIDPEGATQIDGVDTITMDRNGGVIAVTPNNAGNAWEIVWQA